MGKSKELNGKPIEALYKEIQDIYLSNDYPWIVGYSGGKDSTATLQLVWEALERLPKEKIFKQIYVVSSDTLVEIPKVVNYVEKQIEMINKKASEKGLPIRALSVIPDISDTFWVNLIGRGYAAPTKDFRWCTDRLKIKPSNKFVVDVASKYGEAVIVLGVRKAESINREKTINQHKIENNRLSRHTTLTGAFVYTPIEDWTTDEVWSYLMSHKSPWGADNIELFEMYKQANAGECPVIVDGNNDNPPCGNSRFGCWVCTVVKNEKSLSSLIENGETWLKPLQEFRELLVKTQQPENKHIYRDYKKRNGNVFFLDNGSLGRGPYRFEYRKLFLEELLKTEKQIREKGIDIELIKKEEIFEIQRIWKLEESDWDNSAFKIYEKVYGKKLLEYSDDIGIFTTEDKLLIEEICQEENLNPQLIIKLLNIFQYSRSSSKKKSIINKLEKVLSEEWRTEEELLKAYKEKNK